MESGREPGPITRIVHEYLPSCQCHHQALHRAPGRDTRHAVWRAVTVSQRPLLSVAPDRHSLLEATGHDRVLIGLLSHLDQRVQVEIARIDVTHHAAVLLVQSEVEQWRNITVSLRVTRRKVRSDDVRAIDPRDSLCVRAHQQDVPSSSFGREGIHHPLGGGGVIG